MDNKMTSLLDQRRLHCTKRAFTTRRVPSEDIRLLITGDQTPEAGDLVLARVNRLGHHKRIERVDGRLAGLFPGDEILLAYGNRYAPDQFEAEIPRDLSPCHMVAAGGIASKALSWSDRVRRPTEITPLGLIADQSGRPINLARYALAPVSLPALPPMLAVAGTSMNCGKTTTAAALIHGLHRAGLKVGAAKLTGTGAGGDLWSMIDAGAGTALDFTDAGHASTYLCSSAQVELVVRTLVGQLAAGTCDVIVAEIADGLYQRETAALLKSGFFRSLFQRIMFATSDAAGARDGTGKLNGLGYDVVGVSGVLTRSPLARGETEAATGYRTFSIEDLTDPAIASDLIGVDDRSSTQAQQWSAQ